MKNDISSEEFWKIIEAVPVEPKEELIAEEDANGVVIVRDQDGNIRYMMPRHEYDDLLAWDAEFDKRHFGKKIT